MSKIWITRTPPAADGSAKAWRTAGFNPLIGPLLEIEPVAHDPIPKDTVIIFTSKNAVDHIICSGQRVVCVGDATAEKATATGYRDVVSVDGTSEDVTQWVSENLPKTQAICHVSGWHVRGSIIEDLTALGFLAQRIEVYRSMASPNWPDEVFSSVVFYSPLAAKTFAEIAIDMVKDISEVTAICISQAAADELLGLALKSIHIAKRPREDELIMAGKTALASTLE